MSLVKLSIWSRKIHRYLVILISVIGLVMMVTGFKMKQATEGVIVFPFFDSTATRTLHNQLSTLFAIVLGIMMLTGLFLFLYPWIIKLTRKKTV
jgi:hypothetical protein